MKTKYIKVDPIERLPQRTGYVFIETPVGKSVTYFFEGKFLNNEEWLIDYWLEEVEE